MELSFPQTFSLNLLDSLGKRFVKNVIRTCKRRALFTSSVNVTVFIPFKIGFNAALWCCLHVTLKDQWCYSQKTVTLTVRVNEH